MDPRIEGARDLILAIFRLAVADYLGLAFSRAGLSAAGASPGAGVVIVLSEGACGLLETARIMAWYARQGAGQCGPCVFGLGALAGEMAALRHGRLPAGGLDRLVRWGGQVEGRGACRHPDGSVRLLRSALAAFPLDVQAHLGGRPCPGSFGAGALSSASGTASTRTSVRMPAPSRTPDGTTALSTWPQPHR